MPDFKDFLPPPPWEGPPLPRFLQASPERPEEIRIPLTPYQRDVVVQFRFTDVGHTWARVEGSTLIIPRERLDEATNILTSAVDITRDWVDEPEGRAEHLSTKALLEKVQKAAKELGPGPPSGQAELLPQSQRIPGATPKEKVIFCHELNRLKMFPRHSPLYWVYRCSGLSPADFVEAVYQLQEVEHTYYLVPIRSRTALRLRGSEKVWTEDFAVAWFRRRGVSLPTVTPVLSGFSYLAKREG